MGEELQKPLLEQSSEEALENLNTVLRYIHRLGGVEYIELWFNRFVLVVDTNVVVPDMRRYAFSRRTTDLQSLLQNDTFSFVAPSLLEEEILQRLPSLAEENHFNESDLHATWEKLYKPFIKFIPVLPEEPTELVNALRDPSDAAFVQLYEKLKADAVLSDDRDIKVLDITALHNRQFIVDLRRYAASKSIELQVMFGGMVFSAISMATLVGLIKLLITLVKNSHGLVSLV